MQKPVPFLWFDNQAEEAAQFYTSIFKNSKILRTSRYSKEAADVSGREEGSVMVVEFELNGQKFSALNGGKVPGFQLTSAISFLVPCDTQEEIDHLWKKLSEGGKEQQCGWITDKYGVTWQIAPKDIDDLLTGEDEEASKRAWKAMIDMKKLDMNKLREAYEGK